MLPACVVSTVKNGGGSVLVWGCFSFGQNYLQILETNAVPLGVRSIGNNFTFMQDNYPKHTGGRQRRRRHPPNHGVALPKSGLESNRKIMGSAR
jgi:hypothetical protein